MKDISKLKLTGRGRNGYFKAAHSEVFEIKGQDELVVNVHSGRFGRRPPIQIRGRKADVKEMLCGLLYEIEKMGVA